MYIYNIEWDRVVIERIVYYNREQWNFWMLPWCETISKIYMKPNYIGMGNVSVWYGWTIDEWIKWVSQNVEYGYRFQNVEMVFPLSFIVHNCTEWVSVVYRQYKEQQNKWSRWMRLWELRHCTFYLLRLFIIVKDKLVLNLLLKSIFG